MIHIPDLINGLFEFCGGFALWDNVRIIRKDKQIRGVNWKVTLFFTTWGCWNLYFYPSLSQWISFVGGINISVANIVWLWYAIKYKNT